VEQTIDISKYRYHIGHLYAESIFQPTVTEHFSTRKPTVTELNFEIITIELYIVLMGKRTFLLVFM